jgi:predicted PurR-regulated permease PerM
MSELRRGATTYRALPVRTGNDPLTIMAVGVLIVTVLYFGREIFMPIALAVLLAFALAPLVRVFRNWHLPRVPAVLAAVLLAFTAIGVLAWIMASQVTELAADLPRYQETMRAKIVSLKGAAAASDAMEQAADVLARLGQELQRPDPADAAAAAAAVEDPRPPLPVVVRDPPPGPFDTLGALIEPLLHPFAMTGIVIIFVIFILLQREDLRNRFIKLVGSGDLTKTTEALDDAANRLSRLLLTQLGLNTLFGILIGVGLTLIGVPIAALWGLLAGVLRFVPYIGAVIGAAMPVVLAAAVDPGWSMLVQTALLFVVVEPIVGHFLEPMVYGRSTGLSPVAIVVAATFWTWLWGPIGLVLATPMTVCLVVLGRHVKGLSFIEILLGDRPALSPPELFYQRMLAGDAAEVTAVGEEFLKERSLSEYYDRIAIPGLRLAQADVERGVLGRDRLARIRDTLDEVVEDLDSYEDVDPPKSRRTDDAEAAAAVDAVADEAELPILAPADLPESWRTGTPVLCLAGGTPLDEAGATILSRLVAKHGIAARSETADAISARRIFELAGSGTSVVCLSFFGAPVAHMRHSVRRVRRRLPDAAVVLCDFGSADGPPVADLAASTEADTVATSLKAALAEVVRIAAAARIPPLEGEIPEAVEAALEATAGEPGAPASLATGEGR